MTGLYPPQVDRMAATLVRLAHEAREAPVAQGNHRHRAAFGVARRWTDLPGHDDMLLEAELAHVTEDTDRPALRAAAIATAEATLFGARHA